MTARIAIEHLELRLTEWLWLEYRHCAIIDPEVVFTRVADARDRARLSPLAEVRAEGVGAAYQSRP